MRRSQNSCLRRPGHSKWWSDCTNTAGSPVVKADCYEGYTVSIYPDGTTQTNVCLQSTCDAPGPPYTGPSVTWKVDQTPMQELFSSRLVKTIAYSAIALLTVLVVVIKIVLFTVFVLPSCSWAPSLSAWSWPSSRAQ